CLIFYFFFQAEDGIRDFHVTGVQTCALPISITLGRNSIDGRHDVPMYLVMVGGPANVAAELDRPIAHASLDPIYPNPVIETATVSFSLPVGSDVSVVVYDALGREVAALADGYHMAGSHAVRWNAAAFSSGVYFCRLQAGSFTATRPIVRP